MNWSAITAWAAILLFLDAGFGLWNADRFRNLVPGIDVKRIALAEGAAAVLLTLLHFLF
jgi:hypothetical protein